MTTGPRASGITNMFWKESSCNLSDGDSRFISQTWKTRRKSKFLKVWF